MWGAVLAMAFLKKGDAKMAVATAEKAAEAHDRIHLPRLALAAAHLSDGDVAAAAEALADARRIKPGLSQEEMAVIIGRRLAGALAELPQSDGDGRA